MMLVWNAVCGHEVDLSGPFPGKHLGETLELPYHPRCSPMQNREHYHGECHSCSADLVIDARIARLERDS